MQELVSFLCTKRAMRCYFCQLTLFGLGKQFTIWKQIKNLCYAVDMHIYFDAISRVFTKTFKTFGSVVKQQIVNDLSFRIANAYL